MMRMNNVEKKKRIELAKLIKQRLYNHHFQDY
jgi:hypothetical protein